MSRRRRRGLGDSARWLLPRARRDEVLGDLAERRARSSDADSAAAARRTAWALLVVAIRLQVERIRDFPWETAMNGLGRDLRHAGRALRRAPAFSALVIVILALGIGASTTIYSLVQVILLDALGFERSERLVHLRETTPVGPQSIAYLNFKDWRERQRTLEAMAAYNRRVMNLTGVGEPVRMQMVRTNAELFSILRATPQIGRPFVAADDRVGAPRTVILSHGFWQQHFGADAAIVGTDVTLDGQPHTVVGVMPAGFQFPEFTGAAPVDAWVPLELFAEEWNMWHRDDHPGLVAIGRLADGVSLDEARLDLSAIAAALELEYPESNTGAGVQALPLLEHVVGDARPALRALLAAVGFMLLIACANCANLLLVRANGRGEEMRLRSALGAPRCRLVRQLLVESAVLALVAGGIGLGLAGVSLPAVTALAGDALPRLEAVRIDPRAALFALGASLLTGLLFGLAPALSTRSAGEVSRLAAGRSTAGAGRGRLRNALVIAEVALALTLLVGASLTLRSVGRLMSDDAGVDTAGVLTAQLQLPEQRYGDVESLLAFARGLTSGVATLPGVTAAGLINPVPLSGDGWGRWYYVEGAEPAEPGAIPAADFAQVTAGTLAALGVPILRGRDLTADDVADAPPVVVVDEMFAQRWWPGEDPIGKRIKFGTADTDVPFVEVVGVAGHVMKLGVAGRTREQVWVPFEQIPGRFVGIVARVEGDAAALGAALRQEVRALDASLPLFSVRTLDHYLSATADRERMLARLIGGFALMGLLLAALGLYGVLSFAVSQRTREIGIRMALGASVRSTVVLVAGEGGRLVMAGIGAGLALGFAVARVLASELYGVSAADPTPFAAVALTMAVVAAIAGVAPTWRAASVDPIRSLRTD